MAKRNISESFNISFLDIMSCGFGAIILLLMITESSPPTALEPGEPTDEGLVRSLQQQLFEIRGETTSLTRELDSKQEQRDEIEDRVARLRQELENRSEELRSLQVAASANTTEAGRLQIARQSLTEEMQRLQEQQAELRITESIGGVPVDSEYIIFIIDTSGSMFNTSWRRMLEVITDTLDIYPEVKGIQVMNDMGDYLFRSYQGDWIPDTPARRSAIIQRLRNWNPFSNSSPVEGIEAAIRTYYDPEKKISLYVLGDEFTGRSIAEVINTVGQLNRQRESGERLVRIHGIGFPVQFSNPPRYQSTGIRFATLMRELARRNGGTFVGLNDFY